MAMWSVCRIVIITNIITITVTSLSYGPKQMLRKNLSDPFAVKPSKSVLCTERLVYNIYPHVRSRRSIARISSPARKWAWSLTVMISYLPILPWVIKHTSKPLMKGLIVSGSSGGTGPREFQFFCSPSLMRCFWSSESVKLKTTAKELASCGCSVVVRLSEYNPVDSSQKASL